MGAFCFALLPQFIPAGAPVLAFGVPLAGLHVILGTTRTALLIGLARRLRSLLRRPVARPVLDQLAGTVITAFGIRPVTGNH